ncbi:hypothetical protein Tco_1209463 [Tanacetum coccineum]
MRCHLLNSEVERKKLMNLDTKVIHVRINSGFSCRSHGIFATPSRENGKEKSLMGGVRQLRIVLSIDDKLNYLEQPLPPAPVAPAGQHVAPEILAAHTSWVKGSKEIAGLMLMTMEPEIQRNLENLHANDMLK